MEDNNSKILKALEIKVKEPCPRCKTIDFEFIGQTLVALNMNPNVLQIGGPSISAAIITCLNCGFISLHAINPLLRNGGRL